MMMGSQHESAHSRFNFRLPNVNYIAATVAYAHQTSKALRYIRHASDCPSTSDPMPEKKQMQAA